MSGQERLGAAVKAAWAETYADVQEVTADCQRETLAGGNAFEMHGDRSVRATTAETVWRMAVEIGSQTGDWHRGVSMAGKVAEQVLAMPRQRGLIGFAVGQTRAMTLQSVLTRMDELLTAHGYDPIRQAGPPAPF